MNGTAISTVVWYFGIWHWASNDSRQLAQKTMLQNNPYFVMTIVNIMIFL